MGCASPVIGRQETTGVWRIDRTRDGQGNPRVRSGRRLPLPEDQSHRHDGAPGCHNGRPKTGDSVEVSFPIPSCPLCVPSTSVADPHHGWGSFTGVPLRSPVGSTSTSTDAVAAPWLSLNFFKHSSITVTYIQTDSLGEETWGLVNSLRGAHESFLGQCRHCLVFPTRGRFTTSRYANDNLSAIGSLYESRTGPTRS